MSLRLILICFAASFLMAACGSDKTAAESKSTKTSETAEGKGQKAKNPKAKYYAALKKELNLNNVEVSKISAIEDKFEKRILSLKKQKKWKGQKNASNRDDLANNQKKELTKILGAEKYAKKVSFDESRKKKK